ncbi:MAG: transposase [Planctomycetota bacterium]|jgi:hypothetical protein
MAKKKRKGQGRFSRKQTQQSQHASLASLAPVIEAKGIFDPIHLQVQIPQKTVLYRPSDKLVFLTLGMICGSETVSDINHTLRVDKPLIQAFGYNTCADQSVIQETLSACTEENVVQLEAGIETLFEQHNLSIAYIKQAFSEQQVITVDLDLSGQPISKNAEGSSKGYFSGKRNIYGRQLARIVVPETQEIVAEALYPGNRHSCKVFKEMVARMEKVLAFDTREKRKLIRLRLDAGFGTDENINYALFRGYQILAKMFSGNRARVLAQSVEQWVDAPTQTQKEKKQPATRQVGWVTKTHRYMRQSRQFAIRTPNPKRKGGFCYSIIVTTDMSSDLFALLQDYDDRGGKPESSFCQSNQGLKQRKRRKKKFVAQQILTLLCQLAHNLIQWIKHWIIQALEQQRQMEQIADQIIDKDNLTGLETTMDFPRSEIQLAIQSIKERGIKRFVRQMFSIQGEVSFKKGRVKGLTLNPLYPLISRIRTAFQALLKDYDIIVLVANK